MSATRIPPPQQPCWAALVLAHGAGAGQSHPFMVRTASALCACGVAVTTFDFPYITLGRRLPDRMPHLMAAFSEVLATAHRARPEVPLFAGGKSLGGRVATHLAAELMPGQPPLAGIVALGYPLRPPAARRPQDRVSHLQRLRIPLLVVQGTRDGFGGPEAIAEAFTSGGVTSFDVVAVPAADHMLSVPARGPRAQDASDQDWQEAVLTWMRTVVARLRPSG